MAEFTKDRYGVDVLKVELPVNMKFVEGAKAYAGQKAYTRDEAKSLFLESAKVDQASRSFIFPPASATRSSPSRWIWRPSPA